MIIACIAMEELALSHILNAGGEHLQFILGTLPGTSSKDVLAVHKSVTALVEAVTQNQILLKNKLNQVLEFCPLPPPPPPAQKPDPEPGPPPYQPEPGVPPSPPPYVPSPFPRLVPCKRLCEKSALHLTVQREKALWTPDGCLSWRQRSRSGKNIYWDGRAPTQIQLNPGNTYAVQYTLNVCAASPAEGTGAVSLRQSPCGAFTDAPPLRFSLERLAHGPRTLQHVSVLHPRTGSGRAMELSLTLNAKTPLCVERATMDIIEL